VTIQRALPRHAAQLAATLAGEIAAAGADTHWAVPEGGIEASIRGGDAIWYDDADPRTIIWIHPNRRLNPTHLDVMHVWGATGPLRPDGHGSGHCSLLRRTAEAAIAEGWGDLPFSYPRGIPQQPIVAIADDLATVPAERTLTTGTTTPNLALVRLIAAGVT